MTHRLASGPSARCYNAGCRIEACVLAKRRQNQLAKLRNGTMQRTPDGLVLAACWCAESTVMIHETDLGCTTKSCGRPDCQPNYNGVMTRFQLRVAKGELANWKRVAEARGTSIAELIRTAMYRARRTPEETNR